MNLHVKTHQLFDLMPCKDADQSLLCAKWEDHCQLHALSKDSYIKTKWCSGCYESLLHTKSSCRFCHKMQGMPYVSNLVPFHSGQARNFYLLIFGQVKINLQFCISYLVIIMMIDIRFNHKYGVFKACCDLWSVFAHDIKKWSLIRICTRHKKKVNQKYTSTLSCDDAKINPCPA